jgi:hypothetical protein
MALKMLKLIQWLLILIMTLTTTSPIVSSAAQEDCEEALPPRLVVGQPGQVLYVDGRPLHIRSSASHSATIVGQIPEGTQFTVLDGPTCADSIYWWRLKAGTITGWAAEGDGGTYFVGQLHGALTDTGLLEVAINYVGSWYRETFNYSREAKNIRHFVLAIPESEAARADAGWVFTSIEPQPGHITIREDRQEYAWALEYLYEAPGGYFEGELEPGTYRVAVAFIASPLSREEAGASGDAVLWPGITGGGASTEYETVVIKAGETSSITFRMTDANGWACPWLYVSHNHTLERRTEILRNLRGKDQERTEITSISPVTVVDGFIVVKVAEEKDEVTFIDALYLLIDGKAIHAEDNPGAASSVAAVDGNYLVLHRDEAYELRFQAPASFAEGDPVAVVVTGYYVPMAQVGLSWVIND